MPPHHPARDMWDTFHTTTPGVILRTHTSPGQIHVMRELCPEPIRVILPGMCYRYEAITTAQRDPCSSRSKAWRSATGITMADLKGTITAFARRLFGAGTAGAHPVELFPVHRAIDRSGHRLAEGRPQRRPADQGDRLAGDHGRRHGASRGAAQRRLRPGPGSAASPSAWGRSASPCCKYAIDDIRQFWANDLRFCGSSELAASELIRG